MTDKRYLVLPGRIREVWSWAFRHRLSYPRDFCIVGADPTVGMHFEKLVLVGTWQKRKNLCEIVQYALTHIWPTPETNEYPFALNPPFMMRERP